MKENDALGTSQERDPFREIRDIYDEPFESLVSKLSDDILLKIGRSVCPINFAVHFYKNENFPKYYENRQGLVRAVMSAWSHGGLKQRVRVADVLLQHAQKKQDLQSDVKIATENAQRLPAVENAQKVEELEMANDSRMRFTAIFVKYKESSASKKALLLRDVKTISGTTVMDLIEFNLTKVFQALGELNEGDKLSFDARLIAQEEGYKLSRPTKIERSC